MEESNGCGTDEKRDEIEWKTNRRRGALYQVQLEYVIGLILELHSFSPRIFLFVSVILTNQELSSTAKRRVSDGDLDELRKSTLVDSWSNL